MAWMPKPAARKYCTTNWSEYNAALKRRGSLEIWFDPGMAWTAESRSQPGRPQRFSDSAIELCLTLKVLFGLALRQVTGLVASLLKLAKLDWPVPDYTTLCRRQKTLTVALGGRPSSGGLHLLVDSTGIKMMGEGEWKTRKHGASYRRQWRKVHLGIDAETLEIRPIEVTTNAIGDAPILPALLAQIPTHERIATVSGDGAYDTKKCHAAIARRMPMRSFLFAEMGCHGRRMARASRPATKHSAPSSGSAERSGRSGAAIIAAASPRPRCIASNCSVSASRLAPSSVR
jgi:hypothetical protein